MLLLAPLYGVEMFCFAKNDVDFEQKQITGLFLENGVQIHKTVPIPPLIDNAQIGAGGEFSQKMKKNSRLVQPFIKPGKMKTHEVLKSDGRYADLLIPTATASNFSDVKLALNAHNHKVVLKTVSGAGGYSVFAVTRNTDDTYQLHRGHEAETLTESAITPIVDGLLTEKRHIVQPFIRSQTIFGEAANIRICCRRGKGGRFLVDVLPQIGSTKGVASNVSGDRYMITPPESFFVREFGENGKTEYSKLLAFGKEFADYYQALFPQSITSNIGLDVGYERTDAGVKYWLFEVNTYMGNGSNYAIRTSESINQLEYYKHLWKKYNL
jgi:hypothetical protein